MNIATHLLTYNNELSIRSTLKSLLPLNGEIIIVDVGSTDNTVNICRQYTNKIIEIDSVADFSKVRNELIKNNTKPWQFYLEPGEMLATGHDAIAVLKEPQTYFLQVFEGDLITKEVRIWHKSLKLKFIHPVYETLNNKKEVALVGPIIYRKSKDNKPKTRLLEQWLLSNPLAKEPLYYKSFSLLEQKKYKEFIKAADEYLFYDTKGLSAIMLQYYKSVVLLYWGNTELAVRGVVGCIVANPLMAEFWCLLGDVYYKIKQYNKAILYYENALVLGKRRLQVDLWPVEISKYKKYPLKMIESCKEMMTKGKILGIM